MSEPIDMGTMPGGMKATGRIVKIEGNDTDTFLQISYSAPAPPPLSRSQRLRRWWRREVVNRWWGLLRGRL